MIRVISVTWRHNVHKFITILPLSFWLAILLVLFGWFAWGIGGIAAMGFLLVVMR